MIELERIDFKNGKSGKTPLNKTNLNKLQDNVENAINKESEQQNTLREDGDLVRKIKISGASKQETREGYNLVDFSSKGNFENDIFTISGTSNYGYTGFDITDIFKSNAGKTLYFSCESFDFSNSNKGSVQLVYTKDGTSNYNGVLSNTGVFKPLTIPTDTSNVTKAVLQVFYNNTNTSGTTYTTKLTKPMLAFEENLPYEQYGVAPSIEHEAPIKSVGDNINLFDKDKATANHYVLNTTGVLVASQVTSTSDYIEVKANKPYTISYNYNTLQNTGGRAIALYNKEKTFLSGKQFTISDKKVTITPTEDGYMKFSYDNNCFDIKAEQNSKATSYSPYGQGSIGITIGDGTTSETKALYTQQPFRANGNVKDRFAKENGVWYEEHNIKQITIDGDETIARSNTGATGKYRFTVTISDIKFAEAGKIAQLLCNKLNPIQEGTTWQRIEGITNGKADYNLYIYIEECSAMTLDEFKTWLSSNNLIVDYVLKTPILIPCTPEQVEVLNDIYSAYGEGMTNIICNDEIEPVIEIVKETKETVQSENDKAISMLLARIEELEKKIQ